MVYIVLYTLWKLSSRFTPCLVMVGGLIPKNHAVNAEHCVEWVGMTPVIYLGMDGFDDRQHPWPWEHSFNADQEYLYAGFTAFAIELAVREGELVTHAEPNLRCQAGLMISH